MDEDSGGVWLVRLLRYQRLCTGRSCGDSRVGVMRVGEIDSLYIASGHLRNRVSRLGAENSYSTS